MQTTEQKDKPIKKEEKKRSTARDSIVTFHTKDQREKENRSTKKGQKIRLISAFLLATLDARR